MINYEEKIKLFFEKLITKDKHYEDKAYVEVFEEDDGYVVKIKHKESKEVISMRVIEDKEEFIIVELQGNIFLSKRVLDRTLAYYFANKKRVV